MTIARNWTEYDAIEALERFRFEQDLSYGVPFPTVAAFGVHGAVFYHEPNNKTNKKLDDSSTLIISSGGHYFGWCQPIKRIRVSASPAFYKLVFSLFF